MENTNTVILGGGFVGLFTALHLSQQNYPHSIVLVDRKDRFTFKPLLYELLTGEMQSKQICPTYKELLTGTNISFQEDGIKAIDLENKKVVLMNDRAYKYQNLVIALGSQTTYFNTPGAAEHTFPFTTDTEAIALRQHLQKCLMQAVKTRDPEERQQLLTFAIIGAGPAGVELACTLADILPVWYDAIGGDYEEIRVILLNRSNEILKGDINSRLRQTARNSLSKRTVGVELLLDAGVREITSEGIKYAQGARFLATMTIVWTGGTEPNHLLKTLPIPPENRNPRGQLEVTASLQLANFPEVFVGGDCAYVKEQPQPPTAQVAYQQGKAIAHNLKAIAQGKPTESVQVNLRGTLMKLGIGEGVANIFDRLEIKGEIGHLIREATYLELLPKPFHNFKVTAEWLKDEILQKQERNPMLRDSAGKTPLLSGLTAVFACSLLAFPLVWRAAEPNNFQQNFGWSSIPSLLDNLTPSKK
jgi:NADH dehydrogenase